MKKIKIGTNTKRQGNITLHYRLVCDNLTTIHSQLTDLFPGITMQEIFQFVQAGNPQLWLSNRYAELRSEDYPEGTNTLRMIKDGLIKLPSAYIESLADHSFITEALNQVKQENFFFPLEKLFKEDFFSFELNSEFHQELEHYVSVFTTTKEQNDVIKSLEFVRDGINGFHQQGLINGLKIGILSLGVLSEYFILDKLNKDAPFAIDPRLFFRKRKYGEPDFKEQKPFSSLFTVTQTTENHVDQQPE